MHVAMLAFESVAYLGSGMFLNDALVLLDTIGSSSLASKCIEVRPRSNRKLTTGGWEPDGAVIMGTYTFIFSAMACWSCLTGETLPMLWIKHLSGMPCSFTKHTTNETRLLSNLADSAAQRMANRTVQDPLFLAVELGRCSIWHMQVCGGAGRGQRQVKSDLAETGDLTKVNPVSIFDICFEKVGAHCAMHEHHRDEPRLSKNGMLCVRTLSYS